ncbi:MAG: hypothetical protein K2P81_06565 [Bacteriovoracaceae bacterium]|nr:hypothetical protein [Bacteriovoracaceae bacterium]
MFLVVLFFSFLTHASPGEIEVWFLTPPASSFLNHFSRPALEGVKLAAACEQIGDFCFDPEVGLYEKNVPKKREEEVFKIDSGLPQLPTSTSVDRSLVNCDAKYAFDIFCGKAQVNKQSSNGSDFEIWIDTSSSLRAIDPALGSALCQRGEMVKKLLSLCEKNPPLIKGFNTQLRGINSPQEACVNQGLNDEKKMVEWMEESTAKKIVIITDVYEYQAELAKYFESKHAKIRGDRGTFPATQMLDLTPELAKACN